MTLNTDTPSAISHGRQVKTTPHSPHPPSRVCLFSLVRFSPSSHRILASPLRQEYLFRVIGLLHRSPLPRRSAGVGQSAPNDQLSRAPNPQLLLATSTRTSSRQFSLHLGPSRGEIVQDSDTLATAQCRHDARAMNNNSPSTSAAEHISTLQTAASRTAEAVGGAGRNMTKRRMRGGRQKTSKQRPVSAILDEEGKKPISAVPSDRIHNVAKTPFVEKATNVRENKLGKPQIIDRPEPGSLKESPSRTQLRPENTVKHSASSLDQQNPPRPQIIYIKNSDPKEPNGRPQLPHVDAVRRRYRFEDIPDFRQGQWWNERPQISQEYEKDTAQNDQQDLNALTEPPRFVHDDLIPKQRRRRPPSTEKPSTPRPTSRPVQTTPQPDPKTVPTKAPTSPWKRKIPLEKNSTSSNVSESIRMPFITPPSCLYSGKRFEHGSSVTTPEPCLNCTCQTGVLVCFLRVCPAVTAVPEGCFSAREPTECCATIVCSKDNDESAGELSSRDNVDDYGDDEVTTGVTNAGVDADADDARNSIGHSNEQTPTTTTQRAIPLSSTKVKTTAKPWQQQRPTPVDIGTFR
ncbi:hypothetical protein BIW11_12869 [Tropilaelaps mercedesae]|uniref:VWFC domain-containing protein n=1 Tax=Tropilaelaps mercedesae TaxID=418985 RepID=A0A1V9X4G0_9ACAR|nr:hypothetical protein BIW11_12869 [Tropilaelaps mercedesae]